MTITDDIKSRVDIVELVSETVKLRRSGKNYTGFCPFHTNTRTPAFVVFPDTGTWRCFGECNEGGDIFKFVMKKEGLDFSEALKLLAKRAGVRLEALTPEKREQNEQAERLRQLLEEAVIYYRSHLLQSTRGKEAMHYLTEKRGITPQTLENFGIGYAPEAWEDASKHFMQKGYESKDLLQAGLIVEKEEGGYYDRFRNRILFPVRDSSGRMAGFGARVLNPEDMPKFINSPQTMLFDKSSLLYGLDQARKPIRQQDQAVIVEGYLDVVVLHQEGFANAVSPMGTALTEAQMRQLKRFTRRIVMALDPDAAGVKATLRGLQVAREALDYSDDIVFDARGLIHHESRLQADLRVCTLPEGMDPDDVVRNNPEQWKQILESAKPIITHVMDTLSTQRDLDDPKTKSEIASQVMPLIRDVPNAVERDAYRQQLARLLRVDERALASLPTARDTRGQVRKGEEEKTASTPAKPGFTADKTFALEKHILHVLIHFPSFSAAINAYLRQLDLDDLTLSDFENSDHHSIASTILGTKMTSAEEVLETFGDEIPSGVEELLQELKEPIKAGKIETAQVLNDLQRSVLSLRSLRVTRTIEQLRFLQEEALQNQDEEASAYQAQIVNFIKSRAALDRALKKRL